MQCACQQIQDWRQSFNFQSFQVSVLLSRAKELREVKQDRRLLAGGLAIFGTDGQSIADRLRDCPKALTADDWLVSVSF
jgi:hypothetical protein